MSVFQDKIYKQMDWLSQATEPYQLKIITALAELPEVVELSYKDIMMLVSKNYSSELNPHNVISKMFPEISARFNFDERVMFRNVTKCFNVGMSEGAYLDFEEGKLHGSVTIIKIKDHFTDMECRELIASECLDKLSLLDPTLAKAGRMKAVLEIIGIPVVADDFEPDQKESPYVIRSILSKKMRTLILEDKIRFRTLQAANTFMDNVRGYVNEMKESSLANIMKVVIIARNNQPIYIGDEDV